MASSFIPNNVFNFLNVKLTDVGRQMLSLGQLNFSTSIVSDREIDYGIDYSNTYSPLCCNWVLNPPDSYPILPLQNLDGTSPQPLQSVGSATQLITGSTSLGLFSGSQNNWTLLSSQTLGYSVISYSSNTFGTQTLITTGGTYFPSPGTLIYIPFSPPNNSGETYSNSGTILSANPTVQLFYRVMSANTATATLTLDRNIPNFGTTTSSTQRINAYYYPYNSIQNFYGSAVTFQTSVMNLNILRTNSVIGTNSAVSGYTSYGSLSINGFKQYLGFSSETRQFGVISYTNNFSGNTFAEGWIPGNTVLDLPTIMWHNNSANAGTAVAWGIELTDLNSVPVFDNISGTQYGNLTDSSGFVVGRVYYSLRVIIITDPELLTAMTYKSNRNYTLPPLILASSSVPQYPLTTSNTTGLLQSGQTYYVTYAMSSNTTYQNGVSLGYAPTMQCEYISSISGPVSGPPQYLVARLPNSFPYLRNTAGLSTYSGTGWNANAFQLLVNPVNTTNFPNEQIDLLPTNGWTAISSGVGNGIYSGNTIDPNLLLSQQFIVSQQDFSSGSTYVISSFEYQNNNVYNSGLTFGNESMLFGNLSVGILATTYKSIITVLLPNTSYNTSLNPSFDATLNQNVYITEIDVLDNSGNIVVAGKFTNPLLKNSSRFLTVQLEIDF